jgi:transcriptional regulator with XRE-family HTH domain
MLSKRVRQARKEAKLTQEKLGEKLGVSQESIRKIEAGETEMPHYIKELAISLDVNLAWLIDGKGMMRSNSSPNDEFLHESIGFMTASQKEEAVEFFKTIISKNKEILSELGKMNFYDNNHAHA